MAQIGESPTRSCIECHRRKIKCDKSFPCSYCVKVRVECRYPPARQLREKNVAQTAQNTQMNVGVISRIDRIEHTLQSFERTLSQISQIMLQSPASQPVSQRDVGVQRQKYPGLTDDHSAHWGRSSSPFNGLHGSNSFCTPTTIDLCVKSGPAASATIVLSLWQTFLERVDPILKMIHVPTVQQKIIDVVIGREPANIEFHALVSSISYSAVVTMTIDECRRGFCKDKEELLSCYRATVENSLTSANFLHSTDMVALQAFVIYLVCGRFDKKGPDVKHLTRVAVDIAQRNGLNKDTDPALSPFENEMRCRIWWQLYTLDVRNAEDHGLEPCILEPSTTRLPRSINDINLHPVMVHLPGSSTERTEMLFTLDRHEISTLARRILFSERFCQENSYPVLSVSQKCDEIDRYQAKIEDQILSLCNQDIPIDYITVTSSRLVLAKLKLSVTKPKTRQNQHIITQEEFRRTCVGILTSARALRLYEHGNQWLWLFQTYIEWDALAYLFINLSLMPSGDSVVCAWEAAEAIYEYWKSHVEVVFDGRWREIENLRSQALLAKQMYRDDPGQFRPFPMNMGSSDGSSGMSSGQIEEAELSHPQSADIQKSAQSITTAECMNMLERNDSTTDHMDVPVPTTGTDCQWSAALFDRYFQVLDMDHNMGIPWL